MRCSFCLKKQDLPICEIVISCITLYRRHWPRLSIRYIDMYFDYYEKLALPTLIYDDPV